MLSTQYRLRLQEICKSIAAGMEVSLEDMIWAEKLGKINTSARGMLQTARRLATNPNDSFPVSYTHLTLPTNREV